MLGLSTQPLLPRRPPEAEAVRRALAEAGTVSGGYAGPPCDFIPLESEAGQALAGLRPPGATVGTWVLVTARRADEPGHRVHLHERTLTAAQRFMLALACDGIDSQWVEAGPDVLAAAGLDLGGAVPVGAVWCTG